MSFGSFPLSSLPLSPSQLSACEHAGYSTASDILLAAPTELTRKLKNLTAQNIQNIIGIVAKSIAPSAKRVVQTAEEGSERAGESSTRGRWVGTGDIGLDEALGGGLRLGTLTEIAGESAAGKSHLCMVLALSAQLSSCTTDPGGSIIITSERELPTDRLIQLAKSALATHSEEPRPTIKQLLDNITVTRCFDIDTLDHMLCYSLPWELEKRRKAGQEIRLLILDSITALLRGGETTYSSSAAGLAQRSKHICAVADKLKALAVAYDLAIVVINQVSDVFNRQSQGPGPSMTQGGQAAAPTQQPQPSQVASSSYGYSTQFFTDPGPEPPMLYATQARWFSGQSQGYKKEASLGIVWANAINTRVMVSRTGRRRRIERDKITSVSRKRLKRLEQLASSSAVPAANGHDHEDEDDQVGVQVDETTPCLIRKFHVVFSPFAPPSTVDYIITASGVHTLEGTRKILDLASIVRQRQKRDAMLAALAEDQGVDVEAVGKTVEEFGGEVFDDLDALPAEFWDEKLDGEDGTL